MLQVFHRSAIVLLASCAVATAGSSELIATGDAPESPSAVVRVEICEQGLSDQDVWPETAPTATESFEIPAFGIDQLPPKYVDDGVRGTRPSPSLVRLSGVVDLPAGRHRFLIRARSAARLTLSGTLVVETPFAPKDGGDGSQADTERLVPLDLGPGYRFAPRGEYERIAEYDAAGGPVEVTLEVFAGGREGKNPRRVEIGETVVAVAEPGAEHWELLSPSTEVIPYTDAVWEQYRNRVVAGLAELSAIRLAALREPMNTAWAHRREAGQAWLSSTPEVAVPELPAGFAANNPIDHFVATRYVEVSSQHRQGPAGSVDFFREVQPLLERRCVECHRGEKAQAGFRLDQAGAAQRGGDSGPAYVPGMAGESELLRRITSSDANEFMPPRGDRLTDDEISLLTRWIDDGAVWPELPLLRDSFTGPVDDAGFIRRVMLDTVGVPPTADELNGFLADSRADKQAALIDRLLEDPRWADHWMPFWQDLLAENPNILNPTLNNTGPFRWWLYEALLDDLPLDRMVTRAHPPSAANREGGPAGFGIASQNDVPYAAKGADHQRGLPGGEPQVPRCHDSPTGAFSRNNSSSSSRCWLRIRWKFRRPAVSIPPSSPSAAARR